jgi:DNA gyrase subunit B
MATATTKAADYKAESIQIKEGLEHVRARPAMYIGDIYERGLHHLIYEVVDNSVDEAMAGHCTEIHVTLCDDGSISIEDNGRGIPVGLHPEVGKPTVEVCLTKLGAGGKFDKDSYKVSGGLHGVGVSCVNALSEWLEAEVYRDGQAHKITFERGITKQELAVTGKTDERGTKITFLPDNQIFKQSIEFKYMIVHGRLKELAYLNAGLKIVLTDERGEEAKEEEFHFPEGIKDFVVELGNRESDKLTLRKPIYLKGSEVSEGSGGSVEVEIAIQYNDSYKPYIVSYTNNINTIEGGTHLKGFRSALTASLNAWIKDSDDPSFKKMKDGDRPNGDDYREGLVAVISVKVPEPQFEGQTKTKLGNSDVAGIVQSVLGNYLRNWCEQNPKETKAIVKKALRARDGRRAAKKARDMARKRKDILSGGGVAKLRDCISKEPEECELYLVEGDSAGGTAGTARNPHTQAILPLRGKIINVWKASQDRVLGHNEISAIVQTLGTGILDGFKAERLKYHKIVIMCDADVDGSHIRTLILTFFFRHMAELIEQGYVYVAQPPLYKVTFKRQKVEVQVTDPKTGKVKTKKKNKEVYYLDDESFEKAMLGLGLDGGTALRRRPAPGEEEGAPVMLDGEALHAFAEALATVARERDEVERKLRSGRMSVSGKNALFKKFLAKEKDGQLPYARIKGGKGKAPAVYSEEELTAWIEAAKTAEPELKIWRQGKHPLSQRAESDIQITMFRKNKKELEKAAGALRSLGLDWNDLFEAEVAMGAERPAAPFQIVRGQDTREIHGLLQLVNSLRALGMSGVDLQRYKGLGEMDSDELEETTMDPAKRILKRVTMESATGAHELFATLMGTHVEPRRDFIQERALSLKASDLDA